MTLPKNNRIDQKQIDSMKNAIKDSDIRAIHPDKMEEFAEHLVQKTRQLE